jgi:hypothetical protein
VGTCSADNQLCVLAHGGEGPHGRVDTLVGFQASSDQDDRTIGLEGLGRQEGLGIHAERDDGQPRFHGRITPQQQFGLCRGNAGHLVGTAKQERCQPVVSDVHGGCGPGVTDGVKVRSEDQRHLRDGGSHHGRHRVEIVCVHDVKLPSVSPQFASEPGRDRKLPGTSPVGKPAYWVVVGNRE